MNDRLLQLQGWLNQQPCLSDYSLTLASGDASFRRYFRVTRGSESFIVMDAPPEKEDCTAYLEITARLQRCGVTVPAVIDQEPDLGFLLLTDLGSTHYLDSLNEDNVNTLYGSALAALEKIQLRGDHRSLPPYDDTLLISEMDLFTDWLLGRHLGIALTTREQEKLAPVFALLVENALSQPAVFVHRDYHSRNLMVLSEGDAHNTPGILDFQDAVHGPYTYDLVSLLKDCYVKWPRERVQKWALDYFHQSCPDAENNTRFLRQFDLMGVQRHLKASGIFARLYHRDGKPGYLQDIPRTLSYITDLSSDYPELGPLIELIEQRISPVLARVNAECVP